MIGQENVHPILGDDLSDEDFMAQLGPQNLPQKVLPSCDEVHMVDSFLDGTRTVSIDGAPIRGVVQIQEVPLNGTNLIGLNIFVMAKSFYKAVGQISSEEVEET